jgi:hypothetical protein
MNRIIPFALCALLGIACHKSSESAGPTTLTLPQATEHEPNDDSKLAQTVHATTQISGSFSAGPHPDEDWYHLAPGSPMLARLEITGVPGVETVMEVYDADHNLLLHVPGAAGEAIRIPGVVCNGSCFVRLVPLKKEAAGPYKLTALLAPLTLRSEREPNNRYVDAQPFPVGGAIDGYIATPDDEDWYLLKPVGMAAGQMMSVNVAAPPAVRMELAIVRQSDQAPLGVYRAADVGEDIKLPDLALPAAPETGYYLVLRSAYVALPGGKTSRTSDSTTAYTLEVKPATAAPNLELEPNEDAVHATPIDPGKPTRIGFISPKGDADWYLFHVDSPAILRAEVSGVDNVKLVLSLIDPAKKNEAQDNEIARADSGDVKEPQALAGIAVPAGDNYLRVEGALKKIDKKSVRDYANPTDPYTLTLSLDPDDGSWEREPNDKPESATPVEVGREYKGYIQPAGDVDYWRLNVKDSTNVAIAVSAVPKLDLKIVVRDANRKGDDGHPAIIGSIDKNGVEADERLVVPFEPGSYLIEIREKGRESNSQKPYVLSLK